MTAIRTIVVDDEEAARQGVARMVAADADLLLVQTCDSGLAAIAAAREHAPDLLLIDIKMPGMNGLEAAAEILAEQSVVVVFLTAFDAFAVRAFELHAVDYVLKPFDDERFNDAIAHAKALIRAREAGKVGERLAEVLGELQPELKALARRSTGVAPPAKPPAHLLVKHDGRVIVVPTTDIDWIEAADYYVKIHVGGKALLLRETMTALEARLDPSRFVRAHRSALLNLDRVREIQPAFRGEHVVILKDGTRLPLNRSRRQQLEALLGQSL